MRKTININNYLNEKSSNASSRQLENASLNNHRTQKLDYYEQYLERNQLNHSNSATGEEHSPIKRTMTGETADYSNRRHQVNTARYGETSPLRKSSDASSKDVKSLTTQRLFYDRTQFVNSSSKSSMKNEKQWELELEMNVNKLKDIKGYLETQINLLQNLLDETSRNLSNVDLEFEKIKEKVLDYTSQCLDAAFRRYKKSMTRWSKYEDAEKKGLEVVLEVKESIADGEGMLENLRQGSLLANIDNTIKEMGNRVQHYKFTTNEIKKIREECLKKHPTLKEEKILEFERVLEQLCHF